jgi:hypothetical protein
MFSHSWADNRNFANKDMVTLKAQRMITDKVLLDSHKISKLPTQFVTKESALKSRRKESRQNEWETLNATASDVLSKAFSELPGEARVASSLASKRADAVDKFTAAELDPGMNSGNAYIKKGGKCQNPS